MNVKKILKMFLVMYILINLIFLINTKVYATNAFEEVIESAKDFTDNDPVSTTVPIQITADKLQTVSKMVSSILFSIAVGVALITTATLGINFMIQSTEEKAKIKEAIVPLVIGMLVSFGAYGIWKIMIRIFASL